MSFSYRAYGLSLASEEELPELFPAEPSSDPDVSFRLSPGPFAKPDDADWYHDDRADDDVVWRRFARTPGGFLVRFTNQSDFTLDSSGRAIEAFSRGARPEALRHQLLDHLLPLALDLRGSRGLHATAVATPHGVVAFLGASGAGKSTLAARFVRSGFPLVADDCLVLRVEGPDVLTIPGYPGLRLLTDSFETIFDTGPETEPTYAKRRVATGELDVVERPLRQLILLESAGADGGARLTPISQAAAVLAMMSHSFGLTPLSPSSIQGRLAFFATVAPRIASARLSAPRDLSRLSEVEELVLRTLAL